ncbi:hypothetical protein RF11_04951 [Thelohanellus kitauei]|uniref:Uncharacterized protein n=1 Tax=Thelohanellus kitauei TaxID=669202 RepID=A0A0C2J2I3_THEKT|nr:hypothetical protein RF11_04951 [Thelohanellus kitauei]
MLEDREEINVEDVNEDDDDEEDDEEEEEIPDERIEDYITNTTSTDISTLISAVRKFMSETKKYKNYVVNSEFIIFFPRQLYRRFEEMSTLDANVTGYLEMKVLCSDVFIFIFRHFDEFIEVDGSSFIEPFLNFLKTPDPYVVLNPTDILDSIINCIEDDSNKFFFVNENFIYHFYKYFFPPIQNVKDDLYDCSLYIYDDSKLDRNHLSPAKLTKNIQEMMANFHIASEDIGEMLLATFHLIPNLNLIDEI